MSAHRRGTPSRLLTVRRREGRGVTRLPYCFTVLQHLERTVPLLHCAAVCVGCWTAPAHLAAVLWCGTVLVRRAGAAFA